MYLVHVGADTQVTLSLEVLKAEKAEAQQGRQHLPQELGVKSPASLSPAPIALRLKSHVFNQHQTGPEPSEVVLLSPCRRVGPTGNDGLSGA